MIRRLGTRYCVSMLRTVTSILPRMCLIFGTLFGFTAPASAQDAVAPPASCNMELTVELSPDVPNPADPGFLSSLLSDHPGYALTFIRQESGSVVVLEFNGPGPNYLCEDVVDAMRKDSRVESVDVN
jgi:hypothetical protein